MNFLTIPLDRITDNPYQTRQEYGDIAELAGQIAAAREAHPDTFGLLQVPRGRLVYQDTHGADVVAADYYSAFIVKGELHKNEPSLRIQLAFGHRRLRAFRYLHETGVEGYEDGLFPLYIGHLDDTAMIDAVWGENSQRKNISAIEEAELLQKKLEQLQANGGGSQRDVAEAWGIARPTVSNKLRLLQLPPEIQQANREGKLSERVCVDLLRVTEVQTAVNGSDWKDLQRNSWYERPDSPDEIIKQVLTKPDEVTSNDLRAWLSDVSEKTGKPLPVVIAQYEFDTIDGIKQSLCKGCSSRLNDACYGLSCLEVKKWWWVKTSLNELSKMNNWPIADNAKDADMDWQTAVQIKEAYDAGIEAEWRIGWKVDCSLPRPWSGARHVYERDAFEGDGMAGFFLTVPGGRLTDEQVAALNAIKQAQQEEEVDESAPDIAGPSLRDEWRMTASKYGRDIVKAAKLALVEACDLKPGVTADIFQVLLNNSKKDEWIESENIQALRHRLVDFLWDKGKGWEDYPGNAALILRRAQSLLEDAGIDHQEILSTGTKSGDYERDAICTLEYFYDWYNVSWGNHRDTAVAYIEELLERWPTGEDEVLNPLGEELQRVVRFVATWETDSKEDEE